MTTDSNAINRLEARLGRLLMAGVLTSAVLLAAGLVLWLTGSSPVLGPGLLTGGLIILMVTPIVRVVVSLVEYVRMRDWFFVTTTLLVLAVLAGTVAFALLQK